MRPILLPRDTTDAESAGCFTMTDIYNWRGTVSTGGVVSSRGPIYQLDDDGDIVDPVGAIGEAVTGKWLLTAELYMTNGAIFYCKGSSAGGDCDELRIQSTGSDDYYEVRAGDGVCCMDDEGFGHSLLHLNSFEFKRRETNAEKEFGYSLL